MRETKTGENIYSDNDAVQTEDKSVVKIITGHGFQKDDEIQNEQEEKMPAQVTTDQHMFDFLFECHAFILSAYRLNSRELNVSVSSHENIFIARHFFTFTSSKNLLLYTYDYETLHPTA